VICDVIARITRRSQRTVADELLITLIGVMLTVTVAAAIYYYRLINRAQVEYEKAKDVVEDVVMSFSRELKRETSKLDSVSYRIEGNASKMESAIKRLGAIEKKVEPVDGVLSVISENNKQLSVSFSETLAKLRDIETSREALEKRISDLQGEVQKICITPERNVEPVIPIRRDKALAALTGTEIAVLEMLTSEGAKTAPEIKERVQLSREHTARLMKKLYEEGYLERETGKIPFKYNVKKEMETHLKRPETPQV